MIGPLGKVLLTFEEVAGMCSISRKSVSRAVRSGELKAIQAPGTTGAKGRRIPMAEVLAWLQRQGDEQENTTGRFRGR